MVKKAIGQAKMRAAMQRRLDRAAAKEARRRERQFCEGSWREPGVTYVGHDGFLEYDGSRMCGRCYKVLPKWFKHQHPVVWG